MIISVSIHTILLNDRTSFLGYPLHPLAEQHELLLVRNTTFTAAKLTGLKMLDYKSFVAGRCILTLRWQQIFQLSLHLS